MGFGDKNLSEREGLMWSAGGFTAMIMGLFIMIMSPIGVVVAAVGLAAVAAGLYRWSPIKALGGSI